MDPVVVKEETDLTALDDAALATAVVEDPAPQNSDGKTGDQPASGEPDGKPAGGEKPDTEVKPDGAAPKDGDPEAGNKPDPGAGKGQTAEERLGALESR